MLEGLTLTGDSVKMRMSRNSDGRSNCCTRASLDSALRRLARRLHVREVAAHCFQIRNMVRRGVCARKTRSKETILFEEPETRICMPNYRGSRSMLYSLNVKLELKFLLRGVSMKLTMMHKFRVSHSQMWLCGVCLLQVNSQSLCQLPPVCQPHPRMALESRHWSVLRHDSRSGCEPGD
jgi:hypothetical protein